MSEIDEDKVTKVITKLHKVFNRANLTIPEILLAYGNLGYHLGASIAGFHEEGPDTETLEREYRLNPTVDVGLMLQGLLITSWEDNLLEKPEISSLAKRYKEQQEKEKEK